MALEKMTIEKAKRQVEFKTREADCRLNGLTMEQLCRQYAGNLEGIKKMHDRALRSTTGMYRGFTLAELAESVEIYTILSTLPNKI